MIDRRGFFTRSAIRALGRAADALSSRMDALSGPLSALRDDRTPGIAVDEERCIAQDPSIITDGARAGKER